MSNDSVKLRRVLKRVTYHFLRRDRVDLFALFNEEKSVTAHFPAYRLLHIVLRNERQQILLVLNHEHLLSISQSQALVSSLRRPGKSLANSVLKLINEEMVS